MSVMANQSPGTLREHRFETLVRELGELPVSEPCVHGGVWRVRIAGRPGDGKLGFLRPLVVVALVFGLLGVSTTAASAHGDEKNTPSSDLVRIAIAVLEVHPAPGAAVEDKIIDAQEATDKSDVDIALVKQAGEALARGDIPGTKRLLEQSLGECPDADVLFVSDQSPKPPCVAPAHALAVAVARKSVGGTSEVIILIIAALLAIAGLVVIRDPFGRKSEKSAP